MPVATALPVFGHLIMTIPDMGGASTVGASRICFDTLGEQWKGRAVLLRFPAAGSIEAGDSGREGTDSRAHRLEHIDAAINSDSFHQARHFA